MNGHVIGNGVVEVGVRERCGMLDPVRFATPEGVVEPLHRAPWVDTPTSDVPMLQHLRGDFFCAPFGDDDVLEGPGQPHGRTANGFWRLQRASELDLVFELSGPVSGARVTKTVALVSGHPVVYQRHDLHGGRGRLPIGHHAMLYASEPLHLSFSPYLWGATPPEPVEFDLATGRSRLAYPQTFDDLASVRAADGTSVDLTTYPRLDEAEDLVMLASDPTAPFAWSAAVAPSAGWAWFALKDPRVLRSTVLWLSNGGRFAPPWSRRHRRVIGVEEVTSYFHLGHRASIAANPVAERGVPTAVELRPERTVRVRYALGLVPVPSGFSRVDAIEATGKGVRVVGGRHQVEVPLDLDLFQEGNATPT